MELKFIGAAHEVTGSCTLLEACGKKILIDCGLEQGPDEYVNAPLPISPGEVDMVFLTHAHMDHSGKLPYLYAGGFKGSIYSTDVTASLCDVMLRDSAHIQEFEAEWRNRKAKRSGKEPFVPLYTMNDALGAIQLFVPCAYEKEVPVAEGITIRFTDVGHLLGSAAIEVWIKEGSEERKLVFSGDIGNVKQPILKDPKKLTEADFVVIESTYGNRSHGERPDYIKELTEILQRTFDRGGNVVIPAFAVGRSQEMLYFMRQIKEEKRIHGHENFPVFLDSPLAVEATNIFKENGSTCFDEETMKLLSKGINPISFAGLVTSVTSEDSKSINGDTVPKVIISASGMCDAGRIKHHLKHNLWRPESTILFVGYQAVGSLGRSIAEGAKSVKIFGEQIEVKAEICRLGGVSGHGDNKILMDWAAAFGKTPKRFFVNHGDTEACEELSSRIEKELGCKATAPFSGDGWDLISDTQIVSGDRTKIEKKGAVQKDQRAQSPVYQRLLSAAERLMAMVRRREGSPNKDLAKMADQLDNVISKWEE